MLENFITRYVAGLVAIFALCYTSFSAIDAQIELKKKNQIIFDVKKQNIDLKMKFDKVSEALEKEKMKPSRTRTSTAESSQLVCGGPGTIARKFNNPCNVKTPSNGGRWKGQLGEDRHRHAHFKSIFHGIRAAAITLRSYYKRHGIKTIQGIIDRFCGGNPGYVKFLCAEMNLKPDQEFNVLDRIPELVWLMSQYESSRRLPEDFVVTLDVIR